MDVHPCIMSQSIRSSDSHVLDSELVLEAIAAIDLAVEEQHSIFVGVLTVRLETKDCFSV